MSRIAESELEAKRRELRGLPDYEFAYARIVDEELAYRRGYLDRMALRAVCPHPPEVRQYWPDPSGNNGGGHECGLCGQDL